MAPSLLCWLRCASYLGKLIQGLAITLVVIQAGYAQSVKFLGEDRATQGNWKNAYGADGFLMPHVWEKDPPYSSPVVTDSLSYLWNSTTWENRALQCVVESHRTAACWYTGGSQVFEISIPFAAESEHRVSVYCMNWDHANRNQTLELRAADTNALLDTRSLSQFDEGTYLRWNVRGAVKIRVVSVSLDSPAVVSGLFFDPPTYDPAWWTSGIPPVIDPNATINNKGVANIGQAKWLAKSALEALRIQSPSLAESVEGNLVGAGRAISTWNAPAGNEERDKQRAPLLIGQLKAMADPFYSNLGNFNPFWGRREKVTNGTFSSDSQFPWSATTSDDENKAVATIGQLKAVFALRFDQQLVPQAPSLESHWLLNEGAGTVLADSGPGGIPGTLRGGAWRESSLGFRSLKFDGVDDDVVTNPGTDDHLNFGQESFSVSLWFKTGHSAGYSRMLSKGITAWEEPGYFITMTAAGRVMFAISGEYGTVSSVIVDTTEAFNDGQWHHVVATCDQTRKRVSLFIDNELKELEKYDPSGGDLVSGDREVDISSLVTLNASSATPLYLGSLRGLTEFFDGELGDIRVYKGVIPYEAVGHIMGDTDDDGMPDAWEIANFGQLTFSSGDDPDGDSLSNWVEYQNGFLPYQADSDGDGYSDALSLGEELHLKLDETSGSTAVDSTGQGRNGTLLNTGGWMPGGGLDGGGLKFNGGSDGVSLPSAVLNGDRDFTVSFWFKTSSPELNQTLLSAAGGSAFPEFAILLKNSNVICCYAGSGSSMEWGAGYSLSDGRWHHLTIVRKEQVSLYLDRVLITGYSPLVTKPLAVYGVTLGQPSAGEGVAFTGLLDEVRVYSTALDSPYITELLQPNDSDHDGLPDDWEIAKCGNLTELSSSDDDFDGDGVSNRQEFESGTDPTDPYNGQPLVITLVSGGGQTIYNGGRTPDPLVFQVTDGTNPLENVPVALRHLEFLGLLKPAPEGKYATSTTLLTDSEGKVSVYFKADP